MSIRDLPEKAIRFVFWRAYVQLTRPLADRLARRYEFARWLRWPIAHLAPSRWREVHLVRATALGDVLLCTPAMREMKRINPRARIIFYTDYPDLVRGLPFIDSVLPSEERPQGSYWLSYEKSVPPRRHIARIIGDQIGVAVTDIRPSCIVREDLVERFRREWSGLPRPILIVNRRAGPWTPNKDWPDKYWDELVPRLAALGTVVEIGGSPDHRATVPEGSYLDLRGQTSLPELVAAISAADIQVAPITGTVHIAAAVGVPSVVIYGGYEHPDCSGYPGNINLYSPVECASCWLRTPCPHGKKCLDQITPRQVEAAVDRLLAGSPPAESGGPRDAAKRYSVA